MKKSELRAVVAEILEVEPEALTATTELASIPTYDSISVLNLMVALDDEIGLQLDHNDLSRLVYYGDIEKLAEERGIELDD